MSAAIFPKMLPHEDHALLRGADTTQETLYRSSGCVAVIAAPLRRDVQPDGRIHFWGEVTGAGDDAPRVLRVVTLADGETVHNAFFDRGFKRDEE